MTQRPVCGPAAASWKRAESADPLCPQGFQLAQLRRPGVYKPFAIGIFLMAFQQLSGINAVMFYAESIFEEAKFQVKRPRQEEVASSPAPA